MAIYASFFARDLQVYNANCAVVHICDCDFDRTRCICDRPEILCYNGTKRYGSLGERVVQMTVRCILDRGGEAIPLVRLHFSGETGRKGLPAGR